MNKKGFTLIELVMIIVILGILAAVAIPRYSDLATDAKLAVLDGSIAGLKTSALTEFARTKGATTFANIVAQTELDPNVTITATGSCGATASYSGLATTRSFSINSAYCSG